MVMLNEELQELCAKAAVEQDPTKLLNLIRRINELLDRAPRQFPAARHLDPAV